MPSTPRKWYQFWLPAEATPCAACAEKDAALAQIEDIRTWTRAELKASRDQSLNEFGAMVKDAKLAVIEAIKASPPPDLGPIQAGIAGLWKHVSETQALTDAKVAGVEARTDQAIGAIKALVPLLALIKDLQGQHRVDMASGLLAIQDAIQREARAHFAQLERSADLVAALGGTIDADKASLETQIARVKDDLQESRRRLAAQEVHRASEKAEAEKALQAAKDRAKAAAKVANQAIAYIQEREAQTTQVQPEARIIWTESPLDTSDDHFTPYLDSAAGAKEYLNDAATTSNVDVSTLMAKWFAARTNVDSTRNWAALEKGIRGTETT